ncbi:ParA family protein [Kocuria arenosa]|uniref:ParA family protein n=1 Tax=Kocuria arenosa TaxID=3071446 RepID=UPI0034D6E53F
MTVYAVVQPAGGTGKSTLAAELLVALADQGGERHRVVGIDCDVSGTLLIRNGLLYDSDVYEAAPEVLTGRVSAADAATLSASVPRARLVAFDPGLRGGGRFDTVLLVAALREQLRRLQQVYDDVVIDIPPGTSWYTLAAAAVADVLITPVPGQVEAQLGLDRLRVAIHYELTALLKPRPHRWWIVPVCFDHSRALGQEILGRLRKWYPHWVTSPVRET